MRNPAPKSNPRPGTKISKPVFGCELFVAQEKDVTIQVGGNWKLFTAVHRFHGPLVVDYHSTKPKESVASGLKNQRSGFDSHPSD